ncbi:MAG: SRPBCC family protein [Candidatus Nitrosopolaris sp.]
MRTFKHSFIVNCPIDRVWEFYTDIKHLDIITPPEIELKITNATSQKLIQGSEFRLEGKLMILKSRWRSAIKSIIPYQYLDEMLTGPLNKWRHLHKFNDINLNNNVQKQTEVIDEVEFELPYNSVGKLFEGYVSRRLEKFFDYMKAATIKSLEDNT